jgi:hypothetical protein
MTRRLGIKLPLLTCAGADAGPVPVPILASGNLPLGRQVAIFRQPGTPQDVFTRQKV